MSLYPWVNFSAKYPVGIPEIIRPIKKEVNWLKPEDIPYEGILKVRVIPPKNLKFPVLPVHVEEMMLFPLCCTCAKKRSDGFKFKWDAESCEHSDVERSCTNEYTSVELKKALEKGYKIDRFYRGYHYKNWDENLFKHYVRKFLKIKVEATGWPEDVKTEAEKDAYVKAYAAAPFFISLDKNKIKKNPGLR